MTFHVGQKVVCVDVSFDGVDPRNLPGGQYTPNWPIKGEVYTVREVFRKSIRLVEVINPKSRFAEQFGEPAFLQRRFRPIVSRKTDIFALKALLVPGAKIRETV